MVVVAAAVAVMAYVQEKSLKFSNFLPNTSIAKNVTLTREMKMRPFSDCIFIGAKHKPEKVCDEA